MVLVCGLHVLTMKTASRKGCFSSVGPWKSNDLMDIGVIVFWPGLNLSGALTQTVSLSDESEKKLDYKKQQTSGQVEAPTGAIDTLFGSHCL